MKRLIVPAMLMLVTATAGAQVRKRVIPPPEPTTWVTGSLGLFNGNTVSDGVTASTWDLGQATNPQVRIAAERAIKGPAHISAGVAASYTHAPFTYQGSSGCGECPAHMNLMSLGLSFHAGGGVGLHQVLEASAGALFYQNLTSDFDKQALPPVDGNIDPYFTFGYGFGYTINPTTEVSVVQDFGLALHERTGLTSEQSNTLRLRTIRLNLRYGFGTRPTKRK